MVKAGCRPERAEARLEKLRAEQCSRLERQASLVPQMKSPEPKPQYRVVKELRSARRHAVGAQAESAIEHLLRRWSGLCSRNPPLAGPVQRLPAKQEAKP